MTRANRYNIGRQSTTCHPEAIIKLGDPEERTRYRDGGTGDIIETILAMDGESHRWIHTDAAANCLRGESDADTLRNVWAFVKGNVQYRIDKTGHEKVKSPRALFSTGTGDCKSYSIAEGALLRALGIRYKYRFVAYGPGDYSHVYIVARTGDGWVPLDAVHKYPLEEVAYYRKKDIEPTHNHTAIGALPQATTQSNPINLKTIGLLAILFYFFAK